MTIYVLIHEQDTDAAWGSDVSIHLSFGAAQNTMIEEWSETVNTWEYSRHFHTGDDECSCGSKTAVIREQENMEYWRIEEHILGSNIAIKVEGGLVQAVYSNSDINVDVYDLDVSDFPDLEEQKEADERRDALEKIRDSDDWQCVW